MSRRSLQSLALLVIAVGSVWADDTTPINLDQSTTIDPITKDQVQAASQADGTTPEDNAPYHLDMLDNRAYATDGFYNFDNDGTGVNVYIVSTGIRADHSEFDYTVNAPADAPPRVQAGYGYSGADPLSDCVGFGTHAAGLVGGLTYGAAKGSNLWSVKVYTGCPGGSIYTTPAILTEASNWLLANVQQPAVVLYLLYTPRNSVVDAQVQRLTDAGLFVVTGTGVNNADACSTVSPAALPSVFSTGAVTQTLSRVPNSNWGNCTALFAPGDSVVSATPSCSWCIGKLTSTNPAASLAAGVAAQYLSAQPDATPEEVTQYLTTVATAGKVTDPVNSPNRMLYEGSVACPGADAAAELTFAVSNVQVQKQVTNDVCFSQFTLPSGDNLFYFTAVVKPSKDSGVFDASSFAVDTNGSVLCITPNSADPCDGVTIKGTFFSDAWRSSEATVNISVAAGSAQDTYNHTTVPSATTLLGSGSAGLAPAGRLYAVNMQYANRDRVETADAKAVVQVTFSKPIDALDASMFTVDPSNAASITTVTPIPNSNNMLFVVEVDIQPAYVGPINVNFTGTVKDAAGLPNSYIYPLRVIKAPSMTVKSVGYDLDVAGF